MNTKSTLQEKVYMILERSNTKLDVSKDDNGYVLEGIAAVFGEENNNQRIYEEKEYLPHLEYLNRKIEKKSLMGELDHPEKFDVSLKNASHIIEGLVYDPNSRQLKIRVRLLNTPSGKIAQNLVEAGVPISISSRAAGSVKANKLVEIKRIFTYDLVADPGFEQAQLHRVNESLGFKEENIDIYDITKDQNLLESYLKEMEKEGINPEKLTTPKMDPNYVKVEELHNYSVLIKKELNSMKEKINSLEKTSTTSVNEEEKAFTENRIAKLEKYVNYLAENLDRAIQYGEYLADNLDKNIEYSKYVAEHVDRNISYSEYLAKNLDESIAFSDYISKKLNEGLDYSEYIAKSLDKSIGYSEYIAEKLDKSIGYTEYLAENLDTNISNFEKLNEKVSLNENKKVTKVVKPTIKVEKSLTERYKNISSKVDSLLESVKKQKTEELITESKYHFFRFLGDAKRRDFLKMEETEKKKVTEALGKGGYSSEAEICKIWENALTKEETEPRFISEMPANVKPIWESMDQRSKDAIIAQSYSYNLETPYQINHFWNTRNLKGIPVLQKLNENENPAKTKINPRGYSSDYMNSVMEGLNKFQSRK